jgi:cytoskeleton protein RodZ
MSAGTGNSNGKKSAGHRAIGARLRDARIAHKLKPETVAEELHLDAEIIRAIESGDMAALPAPIFVQGYVRSYARLVGLPEDELIHEFTAQCAEPPPLSVVRADEQRPLLRLPSARLIRNVILIMLGIIMLWLAYPFVERLVTSQGEEATEQVPGRLELPPEFDSEQPSDPSG